MQATIAQPNTGRRNTVVHIVAPSRNMPERAWTARKGRGTTPGECKNEDVFPLLNAIAEGNQQAMETLYRRYSRRLLAFAVARLDNPADADEIVVDTMYEVWCHPDRFRGESRFTTWLFGIAFHKIQSRIRSRKPNHEQLELHEDTLETDTADGLEIVTRNERRVAIQGCIDALPSEQRECVHLILVEGCSVAEVAQRQDCAAGTVKTRLFYARRKLRNSVTLQAWRETGHGGSEGRAA